MLFRSTYALYRASIPQLHACTLTARYPLLASLPILFRDRASYLPTPSQFRTCLSHLCTISSPTPFAATPTLAPNFFPPSSSLNKYHTRSTAFRCRSTGRRRKGPGIAPREGCWRWKKGTRGAWRDARTCAGLSESGRREARTYVGGEVAFVALRCHSAEEGEDELG